MTQLLGTILGELGIAQYLEAFLEQGFDSWETILDITESDLDALGVKLGHRRKLQRRIADSRGIASDASLVSPIQSAAEELKLQDAIKPEAPAPDGRETVGVIVTKRKYRRHPKPDENAPERPPSAYVLFSNKMREELKGRNLSFTEIAKLVGENWQSLTAAEKEPFESQAQAIKDKYLSDLSEYKKTPEYRKYISYLQEFKAKHASPSQDNKDASKRVRLSESESQGRSSPGVTTTRTSRSGSGADSRRGSEPPTARQRVASVVSSDSQYTVSLTPSTAITSPDESVLSSAESNCEPHSMDRSPTFSLDPRDQPSLPGPRHPSQGEDQTREHLSMHRHLPSLSDVFDGQGLPGGMHPPSEPGGYRFPTAHNMAGNHGPPLGHPSGDARPAPLANGNGHPFGGSSSSLPPFNHPRPQVDGPLPIHALLSSKSEPTFHSHPPPHLHHPNPYHVDQSPRLVHQPQSGAAGLPMMNGASPSRSVPSQPIANAGAKGYHHHHPPPSLSHHQPPVNEHHINQDFSTQPHQAPPPASGIPQQGKQTANLDGMSALLKAGEIVDRRMQ